MKKSEAEKNEQAKFVSAHVTIIEIAWLDNSMSKFYRYLANKKSDTSIYDINLIKVLLEAQDYRK